MKAGQKAAQPLDPVDDRLIRSQTPIAMPISIDAVWLGGVSDAPRLEQAHPMKFSEFEASSGNPSPGPVALSSQTSPGPSASRPGGAVDQRSRVAPQATGGLRKRLEPAGSASIASSGPCRCSVPAASRLRCEGGIGDRCRHRSRSGPRSRPSNHPRAGGSTD